MIPQGASKNWLAIAGGILLLALIASAQPANYFFTGSMQDTNWYFNYELGYIHRGVMGSLFQLFNGAPTHDNIHASVPTWQGSALILAVIISAAMMFYHILKLNISDDRRALLMAFAALLLLAPVWKQQAYYMGILDVYVFICALAATAALLWRQWALMTAASALGLLIHPMMIAFSAIIGALALHALLFRPQWRRDQKTWLAAALAPLLLSLFLYIISAPENNIALLEKYNYPDRKLLESARVDFLHPGTYNRNHILGQLYAFPLHYLTQLALFLIAPYLITCAVARALYKNAIIPTYDSEKDLPAGAIKRIVAFLSRHYAYLLFAAGVFAFLPITTVHVDLQRILYWSQWGAIMVYIYLLSCSLNDGGSGADTSPADTPDGDTDDSPSDSPDDGAGGNGGARAITAVTIATVALGLGAYTFAGAPLVDIPPARPITLPCSKFCIPPLLDKNPAGDVYGKMIFTAAKSTALPLNVSGKTIRLYNWRDINEYELNGDALVVPARQSGEIFTIPGFTIGKDEQIQIRVTYSAAAAPPLRLFTWGKRQVPITRQTDTETVWQFTSWQTAHWVGEIHAGGGVEFEVERVRVNTL